MIEWLGTSYFSFLEGASDPESLFEKASEHQYDGLCLADRMGFFGAVRGLRASDEIKRTRPDFFYAPGIRLHFDFADPLFIYPLHKKAHGELCKFLSTWALDGMSVEEKGLTPLRWQDFRNFLKKQRPREDFILISASGRFYPWISKEDPSQKARVFTQEAGRQGPSFSTPPTMAGQCPFWLLELVEICGRGPSSALSLAYPLNLAPGANEFQLWLEAISLSLEIPLLATSLPLYAQKDNQELCNLVTAIRHKKKLNDLGYLRQANGERRLFTLAERERIKTLLSEKKFLCDPFQHSIELAKRQKFSLKELKYHYPKERLPPGENSAQYLRRVTYEGANARYSNAIPINVIKQLEAELKLITILEYEDYFLTIYHVLEYARSKKILFQGRGSAANSAVCYVLGITAIDPVKMDLLFERFISMERHEAPDIDVDFEHERREEVIQEIYRSYGRKHAAMVATVICFRDRMAVRETAKALGIEVTTTNMLIKYMGREGMRRILQDTIPTDLEDLLKEYKVPKKRWQLLLKLSAELEGTPRHIGLHTGGFVLSNERLDEQCVLEPARMENRSVVPWDKDDVDYLRWMKVDLLSLGMLTAIRKSFALVKESQGQNISMAQISLNDPKVYKSMQNADTVGVFQIESRAQMNMLPRLAPKCFYDVVIEVAIVRPGPLQGGMVHPYLRRRQGLEAHKPEHPALIPILEKTLGVPIFQEQVMKIAVAVAGFTPGEADQMRKVMSGAWRSKSHMRLLKERLYTGMRASKISEQMIERLYKQVEGFGDYGFPESHAASFGLITYISAWIKQYYPAEFLVGLLNSQPMGFYSPRSLIADAERHGILVLPVDILFSQWDSTLELNGSPTPNVRAGLRLIGGLSRKDADHIVELQKRGILSPEHESLPSLSELRTLGVASSTLEKLISANACRNLPESSISTDPRREQNWELLKIRKENPASPKLALFSEGASPLAPLNSWEVLLKDYATVGFSMQGHPAAYAREHFFKNSPWVSAEALYQISGRGPVQVLGLLTVKQKPPTAGGLAFLTLEDESGFFNLVLMPKIYEKFRLHIQYGSLLAAEGLIERSTLLNRNDPKSCAISIKVTRLWSPFLENSTKPLSKNRYQARDFH